MGASGLKPCDSKSGLLAFEKKDYLAIHKLCRKFCTQKEKKKELHAKANLYCRNKLIEIRWIFFFFKVLVNCPEDELL